MEPLISIIIPCYNAENYIDRCMNSLVHQTLGLEQLEIILVNDASTDSTYEKLLEWESRYPDSVLVINCAENIRQGGARNLGIRYARGTYLGFVDADDWVELDIYEKLIDKALFYQTDIVICNNDRPCSDGTMGLCHDWEEEFVCIKNWEERKNFILKRRSHTQAWLQIYNREWFINNNIQFPEKLFYEDLIMFLVYALADRIYISNERLYHYYKHAGSTVVNNKNPLDRVAVEIFLYSTLCKEQFHGIRDLVDFNFYDKAFSETIFCSVIHTNDLELLLYLKQVLLQYVPDIVTNPYYRRDLPLPDAGIELLLHPIVEHDVTPESLALFRQRTFYCWKFRKALAYLDYLTKARRRLEQVMEKHTPDLKFLLETADDLCQLCQRYCLEPFAHKDKAILFCEDIIRLCSDTSHCQELLDLIDDFSVAITLPG